MAVQSKFRWCLVLVLGTTLSCADPVSEKLNNPNLPKGERLFLQNCASCHGENGDLGASGAANLTTSRLEKSSILEATMECRLLKASLRNRKRMTRSFVM
ncbi:MAG: hypothetical protein EBV19_02255 [Flavobacteriia bacterium]|nr:hypothetical protein [Flavobacteriia bacterium]